MTKDQTNARASQQPPKAQEKSSYQIAAFELNGKNLIAFAGCKNHVSIYPIPAASEAFNKEISKYVGGKGHQIAYHENKFRQWEILKLCESTSSKVRQAKIR